MLTVWERPVDVGIPQRRVHAYTTKGRVFSKGIESEKYDPGRWFLTTSDGWLSVPSYGVVGSLTLEEALNVLKIDGSGNDHLHFKEGRINLPINFEHEEMSVGGYIIEKYSRHQVLTTERVTRIDCFSGDSRLPVGIKDSYWKERAKNIDA